MLIILKQCNKELMAFPEEVRGDLADAIARLEEGHLLSMPLSRPMPSIGKGVHELRLKDRSGIYRVIYILAGAGSIYLLHAFSKKTQKTPQSAIELTKKRLKDI
jgi:phage-related protein